MEGFIIIAFIWGGIWLFRHLAREKKIENYTAAVQQHKKEIDEIGELQTRIKRENIELDGKKFDIFKIEAKGFWIGPGKSGTSGYFSTYVTDQTNGVEYFSKSWPIRATSNGWAEEGSAIFCTKGDTMDAGEGIHYPDWAGVGFVPFDTMEFPFKGKRKITFNTYFCDPRMNFKHGLPLTKQYILSLASSSKEINIEDIGWKEALDNKPRAMELTIKLGVAIASADDDISQDELNKIKSWIGIQVDMDFYGKDVEIKEKKMHYAKYLKDTCEFAVKTKLNEGEISNEFQEIATKQQKYDAIELMLDVMVSDGDAGNEEMKIIDRVAPILGLEPQTVKDLRETRLSKVASIGGSEDKSAKENDESLFGITPSMTNQEKCEQLFEEYENWSERLALPDKAMSKRAKEMCDKIMTLRQKYKCNN